jgi:DNA repair exonuclease SbcCD ATPase subunit
LKEEKEELEDISSELESLYSDLKESDEKREGLISNLSKILNKKINDIDSIITKEIENISKKIHEIEMPFKEQENRFQKLENEDVERIKVIQKVLEKNEEYEKLKEIFSEENKESTDLRSKIVELSILEENFNKVINAINNAQMNLANEYINASNSNIDSFYKTLCNHPYYSCLSINVKPRRTGGSVKNSYEIIVSGNDNSNASPAVSKLSEGQMNSLALSIYLSMSKIFSHNLGFLILDDPSQSLDNDHKKALIEIIKNVVSEKQMFISTQDETFQDLLKENLKSVTKIKIFNFTGWSSKNGPSIKETSV